jgi:uncharacterized protein
VSVDRPVSPFVVTLRELPTAKHFTLDSDFVDAAIGDLPVRQALGADAGKAGHLESDVKIYTERENVFVRGDLEGFLEVACSRCVNPVRVPVEEELHVTFMPDHAIPEEESDDDEAISPDDVDVFPYHGKEINLEPLFREQVILAVPFAPLCNPDCKGLCGQCGADKNKESCDCQPEGDLRLAGLKHLKV